MSSNIRVTTQVVLREHKLVFIGFLGFRLFAWVFVGLRFRNWRCIFIRCIFTRRLIFIAIWSCMICGITLSFIKHTFQLRGLAGIYLMDKCPYLSTRCIDLSSFHFPFSLNTFPLFLSTSNRLGFPTLDWLAEYCFWKLSFRVELPNKSIDGAGNSVHFRKGLATGGVKDSWGFPGDTICLSLCAHLHFSRPALKYFEP